MRLFYRSCCFLSFCGVAVSLCAQTDTQSIEQKVDSLLRKMTLEEKVAQISHIHSWDIFDDKKLNEAKLEKLLATSPRGFVEGFPLSAEQCREYMPRVQKYAMKHTRLGIPVFTVAESLHGSVHEGSTIFPQNIALAATFNPSLAYRRATEISKELHYQGIRQILAPCMDVVRDLRWGRVEECYGEDPFLSGIFACEEVKGYLENGISPMLKHFGAHGNPLGGLNLASVNCGIGELHDIYLYPFKRVITSLPVQAVMSTYNSWNRIPNSASYYLLTDVLRNQWGFKGYVYADWGAVDMLNTFHHVAGDAAEAAVQALTAGLDVEAASSCFQQLPELVKEGKIDEALIDQAVRRVLGAKYRMGLFDEARKVSVPNIHTKECVDLSRQISEESVVLLKNENGLLPLNPKKLKSIAVVGPNSNQVQFGDYSWSRSNHDGVTPLQGIRSWASQYGIEVNHAVGCSLMNCDTTGIADAVEAARKSDVVVAFCGSASASLARDYSGANCGEGFDLSDLSLPGAQEELVKKLYAIGHPVILVLVTGKPFAISWEKEHLPAILVQWYGGEQSGNVIADALFGKVNPSGHLTVSFPQSAGHLPAYYNHLPTDKGFYHQHGSYDHPGRDYVFSSPDPLWAFGHGLSYTSFSYSGLKTQVGKDSISVSFSLCNTGHYTGKAVPQLYVRDCVSSVATPVKQLKAFCKTELKPGEKRTEQLKVAVDDLGFTDEKGIYKVEPGSFELMLGDASNHILLRDTIEIGSVANKKSLKDTVVQGVNGENIRLQGTVRDIQATLIPEVEIYSTRQKKVVGKTNSKGEYSIETPSNDVLLFRKSGYIEERIEVNGLSHIQVKMRYGS